LPESRIAAELEQAYCDGMKKAAAFEEEKGQRELATLLRRFAGESR
jgi:hypothetical protein